MSNNVKIIVSAVIMAVVVSLLFLVVPITGTFVVSYIFALIAIAGIASGLYAFGKSETTKAPQGHAFVYTAVVYAIISVIFSVIACVAALSLKITMIIHIAVLAIFVIMTIALVSGSEFINKTEIRVEEKNKEFQKEKESYWR